MPHDELDAVSCRAKPTQLLRVSFFYPLVVAIESIDWLLKQSLGGGSFQEFDMNN